MSEPSSPALLLGGEPACLIVGRVAGRLERAARDGLRIRERDNGGGVVDGELQLVLGALAQTADRHAVLTGAHRYTGRDTAMSAQRTSSGTSADIAAPSEDAHELSTSEVAERLGVDPRHVRRLGDRHGVRRRLVGRALWWNAGDVAELVRSRGRG